MTSTKNGAGNTLWTNKFIALCMVYLFTMTSLHLGNNALTLYIDDLGRTPGDSGTLAAVFAVIACVSRPLAGYISDRANKLISMFIGGIVIAVATLGFMLTAWFPALILFRALQGLGFSFACTAAGASVADVVPKERLGEGLGYFGLGGAISMALGPVLGLSLISWGGYNLMFLGLCGTGIAIVVFSVFSRPEKNTSEKLPPDLLESEELQHSLWTFFEKTALPGAIIQLMAAISICGVCTFMSLYASQHDFANASTFFVVTAVFMILARIISGKVFDRFGALSAIIPSFIAMIIMLVLLAVADNALSYYTAAAFNGITWGILTPCLNTVALYRAKLNRRGAASATYNLFYDGGQALGNAIWGAVITAYGGFCEILIFGAVFAIPTCALSIILFKDKSKYQTRPS